MSRTGLLILLGILTIVIPFSGIPVGMRTFLIVVCGASVLAIGFTLRAKDGGQNTGHKYNPRRIGFFEGKSASNPTAPKGGFAETGSSGVIGAFYDPWGAQYGIIIDADYDNQVTVPYTDFASAPPQTGVAAYSMGKDGKLGTAGDKKYKSSGSPSDDVISWQ